MLITLKSKKKYDFEGDITNDTQKMFLNTSEA